MWYSLYAQQMKGGVVLEKPVLSANILFSGIGFQEWGFRESPYQLDVVNTSEIEKNSILSYACIHNGLTPEVFAAYKDFPSAEQMIMDLQQKNIGYNPEKKKPYKWELMKKGKRLEMMKKYWLADRMSKNLGDICLIKRLEYADLWFVSFPCQSISNAGKMKGFRPDSGTRSSLLWENVRLLKQAKGEGIHPKMIMFENVKALVSKKFKQDFLVFLDVLSDLGYYSYWNVLNAKYCGIPQNRERVFVVCFRKDLDINGLSEDTVFPKPFFCDFFLEDILEETVEERFYIKEERKEKTIQNLIDCGLLPDADT